MYPFFCLGGRPVTAARRLPCAQGSGTLYSSNGDVFTGSWNANKRHGKGKLAYEGGDYYDGDFVGGLREGYGVLTKSASCPRAPRRVCAPSRLASA